MSCNSTSNRLANWAIPDARSPSAVTPYCSQALRTTESSSVASFVEAKAQAKKLLVLTTIGETYHFRATGKARLKAWDDARLLLTKYYDHRLEKLESKDADTQSSRDEQEEEAPLTGQALTAKYKREYKHFKDELDPIYKELRGAKFADAEA